MSQMRRPSLLGALLWIGLGILFLLRNFGIGLDFWSLAGRYWPILLILLGLGKVLDYFLKKDAVSIHVGEIIGILVLLLVGTALTRISDSHMGRIVREWPINIGGSSVRPGQYIGESHTYSEEATYPLGRSMPIRIENSYGSVSVSPGSDREVRVRLKKVIYANEPQAMGIAGEVHLESISEKEGEPNTSPKPEAEPGKKTDAERFVVRTNREALSSKNYSLNTDMEVFVPKDSQLQVVNTFGEVRIAEINGKLDLSTTHRDLTVRDCTGQFAISTRYADARLTNLTGNVSLDGRGRVYAEDIKGDVSVTDEYSRLEILRVDGKVSVSTTEGSIRIEEISKPVVIDARGTRVQVSDLKDSLKVTANYGNVDISEITSNITLESRNATVTLKEISGNIDINSNSDRISADEIRGRFTLKAQAGSARLNGISGPLNLQTTRTDIVVKDLAGGCDIINEYADVRVSIESLGKGDIHIKNQTGGIDLSLPDDASFSIDATARNGKIESDYAGLEPSGNQGNAGVLRSRVKAGGTKITLETDYSNIHIYPAESDKPDRAKKRREGVRVAPGNARDRAWNGSLHAMRILFSGVTQ
jgi:DUF4097 and DUF4098 domain-containing protein YvlB